MDSYSHHLLVSTISYNRTAKSVQSFMRIQNLLNFPLKFSLLDTSLVKFVKSCCWTVLCFSDHIHCSFCSCSILWRFFQFVFCEICVPKAWIEKQVKHEILIVCKDTKAYVFELQDKVVSAVIPCLPLSWDCFSSWLDFDLLLSTDWSDSSFSVITTD